MNKALWAVPALALLGTASVAGVIVASPGGEEEVVQQPATATASAESSSPTPTLTPAPSMAPAPSVTPAWTLTPTPAPGALSACPPLDPGPRTRAPTTREESKQHTDTAMGYSVALPAEWSVCQAAFDPNIRDLVSQFQLLDSGSLLRVTIAVYRNPAGLPLEQWIKDHNSLFFTGAVEARSIGGKDALVSPLNWEGFPAPHAYVRHRDYVVAIVGWHTDFDAVVPTLTFNN